MVYRRPVADGQGFAAAGPVDDAVSQKVSDSVHLAQEEQHLDDLALSTRQRQEAVQELTGSSAVYNSGISAAGPMQRAGTAASAHLPGVSAGHAGGRVAHPREAAVPLSPSPSSSSTEAGVPGQRGSWGATGSKAEAATAVSAPAGRQAEHSAGGTHSSGPGQSYTPKHLGLRPLTGARKTSSLQGARPARGGPTHSTYP